MVESHTYSKVRNRKSSANIYKYFLNLHVYLTVSHFDGIKKTIHLLKINILRKNQNAQVLSF